MTTKYIFVSGGVISGLGKGISAASIAFLLKNSGFRVVPIKFENYLNLDAGIINPIEHGDPFLCEDGTEADMDLGTYEKFLDQNMTRKNFVTMGLIYKTVIEKERAFEYKGEDVEAIPHITDEIFRRIEIARRDNNAEIVIVELGGTAGEYQNILYYEASRLLALRNPGSVVHVHVSYLPTPPHLGEPKTKPTQLSVKFLNTMGIQPDFIVARAEKPLDKRRRERFALFCNLNADHIISSPDVSHVYEVPLQYLEQDFHKKIMKALGLPQKSPDLSNWKKLVERIKSKKDKVIEIAIVGKYFKTGEYQLRDSYAALFDALDHAAWANNVAIQTRWIDAEKVESAVAKAMADKKDLSYAITELIGKPEGIIVPIGWGPRGAEGMIMAASYGRKKQIPYLGLCYGMQLAAVAFARDILGLPKANTTENAKNTPDPIIQLMPAQKDIMKRRAYGGTMRLGSWDAIVKKGTIAYTAYEKNGKFIDKNKGLTSERHRHRYEFNDKYAHDFEKNGMTISARSVVEKLAEIIELPRNSHPFYLGTQGHPEYKSRPLDPHPLFIEFIAACKGNKSSTSAAKVLDK
ncbi:CTP synthase [Candidatus Gottesmanbacteria bacterium]|nr:CTP synthase [Candidatus Gottesmanbacteria bacterium]